MLSWPWFSLLPLAATPQSQSELRLCDHVAHSVKLPLWQQLRPGGHVSCGLLGLRESHRGVCRPWELFRVVGSAPSLGDGQTSGLIAGLAAAGHLALQLKSHPNSFFLLSLRERERVHSGLI